MHGPAGQGKDFGFACGKNGSDYNCVLMSSRSRPRDYHTEKANTRPRKQPRVAQVRVGDRKADSRGQVLNLSQKDEKKTRQKERTLELGRPVPDSDISVSKLCVFG